MKLPEARKIAEEIVGKMKPFTDRILLAGSIRREKAEVKDIEICAIPKYKIVEETGEIIPCPSEKDFFYNAGLQFVPVHQRENSNPYAFLRKL